jgi:hypothetical protein
MQLPSDIKSIIDQVMESSSFKERWLENFIHSHWTQLVGEQMAQHIQPGALKKEQLTVFIDDERWVKAFEELQDTVLNNLEKGLAKRVVKGFVILPGKKRNVRKGKKADDTQASEMHSPSEIAHETEASLIPEVVLNDGVEEKLSQIRDTKVRDALRHLLIVSKKSESEKGIV